MTRSLPATSHPTTDVSHPTTDVRAGSARGTPGGAASPLPPTRNPTRRPAGLPTDSDVIFVEVTVTDPSDFETGLLVRGSVVHDRYRVLSLASS